MRSPFGSIALLALGLLSSSCATVDRFGPRSVTYNQQIQEARRAIIIDNILRASDDQPLQFSDVTTATGQATGQISLGSDLPLIGPRAGGARLFAFSPGIQASGGPTFTVTNLNTQEFYNGIIAEVKPDIIARYVNLVDRSRRTSPS